MCQYFLRSDVTIIKLTKYKIINYYNKNKKGKTKKEQQNPLKF